MTRKKTIMRLYPDPDDHQLYVRVTIWPTKKAMLKYAQAHYTSHTPSGRPRQGVAHNTQGMAARRFRGRCVAFVELYWGGIGAGIVSHELLHAAISYANRCRIRWEKLYEPATGAWRDEETLTYALGELCQQFVTKTNTILGITP